MCENVSGRLSRLSCRWAADNAGESPTGRLTHTMCDYTGSYQRIETGASCSTHVWTHILLRENIGSRNLLDHIFPQRMSVSAPSVPSRAAVLDLWSDYGQPCGRSRTALTVCLVPINWSHNTHTVLWVSIGVCVVVDQLMNQQIEGRYAVRQWPTTVGSSRLGHALTATPLLSDRRPIHWQRLLVPTVCQVRPAGLSIGL